MPSLEEITDIVRTWASRQAGVLAVYVHGSYARGSQRPDSDIDLAVLYRAGAMPEPLDQLRMTGELQMLFSPDVDVLILNTAPELIASQVLRYGKRVHTADKRLADLREIGIWGKYFDFGITRRPTIEALRSAAHG